MPEQSRFLGREDSALLFWSVLLALAAAAVVWMGWKASLDQ